jgi:hypothetical protein
MSRHLADEVEQFSDWFLRHSAWLRNLEPRAAAEEIGERLLQLDDRLGVEVATSEGEHEIIFTAFSDPGAFSLVRRIAGSLRGVTGWKVVALKPPRGFAFSLSVGGQRVEAGSLQFAPIPGIERAIWLVIPPWLEQDPPAGSEADEMAWLIVETGIGEELAGLLEHVEFATAKLLNGCRPLQELSEYIQSSCLPA